MTSAREALIEKLVVSLHLSVPERGILGGTSVSFEEVACVVSRFLQRDGVFPPAAKQWQPGQTVFEGFFLLKRPDGTVRMTWQRSHPIRPSELAECNSSDFDNADKAVAAFIKSEWSTGIDGIAVSPRHPA
jgi:hypothetical protein